MKIRTEISCVSPRYESLVAQAGSSVAQFRSDRRTGIRFARDRYSRRSSRNVIITELISFAPFLPRKSTLIAEVESLVPSRVFRHSETRVRLMRDRRETSISLEMKRKRVFRCTSRGVSSYPGISRLRLYVHCFTWQGRAMRLASLRKTLSDYIIESGEHNTGHTVKSVAREITTPFSYIMRETSLKKRRAMVREGESG